MIYTFWGEHAMQQNHQHDGTFAEMLFQTEPLKHNKQIIDSLWEAAESMCGAYLHFDAGAQWIGFNMTYKRQNGVEIMDGKLGPDHGWEKS